MRKIQPDIDRYGGELNYLMALLHYLKEVDTERHKAAVRLEIAALCEIYPHLRARADKLMVLI